MGSINLWSPARKAWRTRKRLYGPSGVKQQVSKPGKQPAPVSVMDQVMQLVQSEIGTGQTSPSPLSLTTTKDILEAAASWIIVRRSMVELFGDPAGGLPSPQRIAEVIGAMTESLVATKECLQDFAIATE